MHKPCTGCGRGGLCKKTWLLYSSKVFQLLFKIRKAASIMLKKLRMSFPLLALVLAVAVFVAASAFTDSKGSVSQKSDSVKAVDPVLYWFDASGNYTFRQNTQPDEIIPSGCPDEGSVVCERGYSQGDLLDPEHPEDGLKEGAIADDFIMKVQ